MIVFNCCIKKGYRSNETPCINQEGNNNAIIFNSIAEQKEYRDVEKLHTNIDQKGANSVIIFNYLTVAYIISGGMVTVTVTPEIETLESQRKD